MRSMRAASSRVERDSRGRRRSIASPPDASGTMKRTRPLPPRASASSRATRSAVARVRHADGHLQPRALGEVVERLEALDRDARRLVAGAAVELDREQPALRRPWPPLRAPRSARRRTPSRRTGPSGRSASPSCSGGPWPRSASARPRPAPAMVAPTRSPSAMRMSASSAKVLTLCAASRCRAASTGCAEK